MKQYTRHLILVMVLTIRAACAQDKATCEQIVHKIYEALNQREATPILAHLAEDFSIAGHKGEIARLILPQLFVQLNTQVSNIKKISDAQTEVLTLVYEAEFAGMGTKTSTFVFNKDHQILVIDLLKMEAKVMQGNTKIQKNQAASFSVPFKQIGNLVLVEAILNGVSRNFLVDNGAPRLVLNNAHLTQKDATGKSIRLSNTQGVGGAVSDMDIEKIEHLDFAGIQLYQQEVVSMDLRHLEQALHTEIYGLIGQEIYQDYDVLFDYTRKTLTFIQPDQSHTYLRQHFGKHQIEEVPIRMNAHIATVEAKIGDKSYSFGIDCGAESNLIASSLADPLKKYCKHWKTDTLIGADKNVLQVGSATLHSLQIGQQKFKQTKVLFSDMTHLNKGYSIALDGLIGYEVLSRQVCLLSYKSQKLIFVHGR